MLPGQVINYVIWRQTLLGSPAAGCVLSDFIVTAMLDGAPMSVSPALTAIGAYGNWYAYKLAVTNPGVAGFFNALVQVASGTDALRSEAISGEILAYDDTSLANIFVAPLLSVTNNGSPTGDISLRLVKNTYATVQFTVTDQAGNVIDLSGYTNANFGVKNKAQDSTPYAQTTGITMTSGGLVTIAVPETAAFYSLLTPAGTDSITLYWTLDADKGGVAAQTVCLARGVLVLVRTEL